ncbi:MAG: sugar ABC transporter permease [Pseudobutyrivibrio sp.]|uniref:sugar ABC transporter permease n=1 Tax=Pseudobutyrivibrio sp. TaxID=2014367 RepID=UPI0025FF7F2F|nr:sugar ABC transporter permease [Pseudobutyrivibrio sp.]MBQ8489607.1 sugar ABC transporter permease [Pseudobutyrivibrio sp.]
MRAKARIKSVVSHIGLVLLSVVWLFPIFWVIIASFRKEKGSYTSYFFPKAYTLDNYRRLLFETEQFHFAKWFGNTLLVAIFSCLISTIFVLSVSFCMSRLRFRMRKPFMNMAMILGMFPGFMSMIAVYYILKGLGITQSLLALVMVYSGASGAGFFVAKGFFDTISKSMEEAASLEGATRLQIFTKIILPLSKPIAVTTILTSFMGPWVDYIFASVIMGDNYDKYTVAIGLAKMLEREFISEYYTQFAAGCVLVSIPISILFMALQRYYVEGITSGASKG